MSTDDFGAPDAGTPQPPQSDAPAGPPEPAAAPAPAAAAPPAPAPAASGPGWGAAFPTWWRAFKALYQGDPATASDILLGSKQHTGNAHALWIVSGAINALLIAIVAGLMVTNANQAARMFGGGFSEIPFILMAIAGTFIALTARAGAVMLSGAVRGKRPSFAEAASLASIPFVAAAPLCVVLLLVSLMPGQFLATIMLVSWVFVAFFSETALYIAVARWGRFEKSLVLPHALFSTLWLAVVAFTGYSIASDLVIGATGFGI